MPRFVTIALCCVSLLFAFTSAAQTPATTPIPNLVRYGGVLKDAQGAPLASTTTGVTFAIYKQQDGGSPIWMETQNVTTDAAGDYSVLLGGTTAAGLPGDLFSEQEQRWLGVQVQGQPEQARVMMVSVPYAFHAGEAEKLAGHSVSEFVTTDNLQTVVQQQLQQTGTSGGTTTLATKDSKSGVAPVPTDGATDFIDTTTDQVVLVQQNGTGVGLSATAPSNSAVVGASNATPPSGVVAGVEGISSLDGTFGVYGLATSTNSSSPGIGAYGQSNSPNGIGLEGIARGTGNTIGLIGQAISTSGFAIDATETATSGSTVGMLARIFSPTGTAALILNSASGNVTGSLISARTAAGVQFTVDGHGNVNTMGTYTGSGAGLTGLQFSQLGGTLANAQFSGTYSNTVTLSSTNNAIAGTFTGNGAALTGLRFGQLGGVVGSTQLTGLYNAPVSFSNPSNTFFGNGAGLTGIQFSQLAGQLTSAQFSGTYSNGVTLSNTGNIFDGSFAGNGSGLTGVVPAAGSPFYVQNGTTQQTGTSFNIDGNGTVGGTLSGNAVNSATNYALSGTPVLSATPSNLFVGESAGQAGPSGSGDTFLGSNAGQATSTGANDTFVGTGSAVANTSGTNDTFVGVGTGAMNLTNSNDTFVGTQAGQQSTADSNTFVGYQAGFLTTTGGNNVFVGAQAGYNNVTGMGNTYITSQGPASGTESNTIRIGAGTEIAAYMAGIFNSTVDNNGVPVFVDDTGLLGTVVSSRRFKEQIQDMGDSSSPLMKLRPVTYLYKPEYSKGPRTLQYGLIAEEVAQVYPELAAYDKDGQPYTVRYQYLAPMLLNELQKQYRRSEEQAKVIEAQQREIDSLKQQLQVQNVAMQERLMRLERLIGAQTQTVAETVTKP